MIGLSIFLLFFFFYWLFFCRWFFWWYTQSCNFIFDNFIKRMIIFLTIIFYSISNINTNLSLIIIILTFTWPYSTFQNNTIVITFYTPLINNLINTFQSLLIRIHWYVFFNELFLFFIFNFFINKFRVLSLNSSLF